MSGDRGDYFFWSDWLGDVGLKVCSHAAKGYWMDMLAICATSKQKGYLLINGLKPTTAELVATVGGSIEEADQAIAELEKWGVFSRDRRGVIYSRKMVNAEKRRRAASKGGRIGGPITLSENKGIHSTRGVGRTPNPPHPSKENKNKNSLDRKIGVGNGFGKKVSIPDPLERLNRFASKLAKALGPDGWSTVMASMDKASPEYARALDICKRQALAMSKGWPLNWPTQGWPQDWPGVQERPH